MMNETTINKLIHMRLTAMADALRMQQSDRSFAQMSVNGSESRRCV
jgi:hypothetical protein